MKRTTTASALLATLLCGPLAGHATPQGEQNSLTQASDTENQLITTLRDIQEQRVDGALEKIGSLVQSNPQFKLAQLIYADLLLAKAGPIRDFGSGLSAPREELDGLKNEAQARWQHHDSHPGPDYIPGTLLQLAPETRHAIVVDISRARLYLYEHRDGRYDLITDYYVSIGKNGAIKEREGDKRTPIGVYQISNFLPPEKLPTPNIYGAGAFPLNYPNALDRLNGKTGHGIWLHGTPVDTYSRRPRASDGCVTLSNGDLEAIKPLLLNSQTPIIITENIEWLKQDELTQRQERFNSTLESWRQDWESLDVERYLSHYSLKFRSDNMDYASWALHKRRVGENKGFINVALEQVNIFAYPGQENLRVVIFDQRYNSNNHSGTSRKQQYWQREADSAWRIIYEGPAS